MSESDKDTAAPTSGEAFRTEALRTAGFFFRNLFDLRMRVIVSVCTLPIVYGLGIVIVAAWVICMIVDAFADGVGVGLFWLVLAGPVVFVALVASLRVFLEFMLAIFRMSMQVDAVARQTEEIAVDLPRLQFWKSFRIRREGGE